MKEIAEISDDKMMEAFRVPGGLCPVIQQTREFVEQFEHDMTTAAGRKATASLARKVSSLKVKIDGMGKDLVTESKEFCKRIDSSRKAMREEMDGLKVEARLPLTLWEAEQARIKKEADEAAAAEAAKKQLAADHEIGLLLNEQFDAKLAEQARIEAEQAAEQARQAEEERKKDIWEAAEQLAADKERNAENKRIADIEAVKENARIEAAQAAKEAERRRLADVAQAKQLAQLQSEQATKPADPEAERAQLIAKLKDIKAYIIEWGVDEATAKAITLGINAGKMPHVSIN